MPSLSILLIVILINLTKYGVYTTMQTKVYQRKSVGYNSALDENKMEVTPMVSRHACGAYCTTQGCVSFTYDAATRTCTLYSVYMTLDGEILNNYYAILGAPDSKPIVVVTSCTTVSYDSSFTNVALNKAVTMSSQYDFTSITSLLVNGQRNSVWPCASTAVSNNPYMVIDIGQDYSIHSMFVLNRGDCCPERLFNLKIELGVTLSAMAEYVYHSGVVGAECTFVLDTITVARYVRVSIVGYSYLTLCQLEVYSYNG